MQAQLHKHISSLCLHHHHWHHLAKASHMANLKPRGRESPCLPLSHGRVWLSHTLTERRIDTNDSAYFRMSLIYLLSKCFFERLQYDWYCVASGDRVAMQATEKCKLGPCLTELTV